MAAPAWADHTPDAAPPPASPATRRLADALTRRASRHHFPTSLYNDTVRWWHQHECRERWPHQAVSATDGLVAAYLLGRRDAVVDHEDGHRGATIAAYTLIAIGAFCAGVGACALGWVQHLLRIGM